MAAQTVRAGRREVEVTHPGKVLFPADGITKRDLVDYYLTAAGRMLPHLADRPLMLARFPEGIDGQRIVQKNVPSYFPGWIQRAEVPRIGGRGGAVCHVIAGSPAALAYLANQACIEAHVLLSRVSAVHRPDQLVFDLDPPGPEGFGDARLAALALRGLLEDELGLVAFPRTTGGNGLHVHVPLRAEEDFDAVRGLAAGVAGVLAGRHPDLVTTERRRAARGGRVYADIMRNAYAQTVIAPYAVRARPGATVSAPLRWDEVADPGLNPQMFTLRTMPERLAGGEPDADPWAGMGRRRRGLRAARGRLSRLAG